MSGRLRPPSVYASCHVWYLHRLEVWLRVALVKLHCDPVVPSANTLNCGVSETSTRSTGHLDGTSVLDTYPPLAPLQQKRLAARRHKTTYCYDFPSVFGNALREAWATRAAAGEPNAVPPPGDHFSEDSYHDPASGCFTWARPHITLNNGSESWSIVRLWHETSLM